MAGAVAGDPRGLWIEALSARDLEAIGRLLPIAPDINAAGPDGRTALMTAAAGGRPELVTALLARGAHADARNRRGGTALMYAATAGDADSARLLLDHGAQVNAAAQNGWTALMLATARGFDPVVRLLLAHGADPDVPDIYGTTPLIRAAQEQRLTVARRLLEDGHARTDARDESGATALHHAARQGQSELACWLLAHGADPQARSRAGHTPVDLALAAGHTAVAERLRRAAAGSPLSTKQHCDSSR